MWFLAISLFWRNNTKKYKNVSYTGNRRKLENLEETHTNSAPQGHTKDPQSHPKKFHPNPVQTQNRAAEQRRDYSERKCQTPCHWTQWSDDAGRYTSHTVRSRPGEVCHSFSALELHQNQQTNPTNSQKQKIQNKHQTYKNTTHTM